MQRAAVPKTHSGEDRDGHGPPIRRGRGEDVVVLTLRVLAACFAIVGILFLITPDGVIARIDELGSALGSFAAAPPSDEKLWVGLAVAYMTVITGIALVVSFDVARYRPLLLVLAAGKAASSLTALWFFIQHDVFVYLANFIVDGGLVAIAIGCWLIVGRAEVREPG